MPPRPEAHGFTKFILSIGVFLCVAAFVVPGLILRDIDALLVSERELAGLTPIAREEIRSRQATAQDLRGIAPWAGIVLFAGGLALLWYGFPRLRRQEEKDEVRTSMETRKLESELEPQSEAEKLAELAATIEEVPSPAPTASPAPPTGGMASPPSSASRMRRDRMRRVQEIEQQVLDRLAEIARPGYELRSHVKLAGTPNLFVDGLLISPVDQLPDILVEVALGGPAAGKHIGNRLADTLMRATTYRNRLGRHAIGWLIVVLEEPLPAAARERIAGRMSELEEEIRLTTIEPEEIQSLTLPVG